MLRVVEGLSPHERDELNELAEIGIVTDDTEISEAMLNLLPAVRCDAVVAERLRAKAVPTKDENMTWYLGRDVIVPRSPDGALAEVLHDMTPKERDALKNRIAAMTPQELATPWIRTLKRVA